MAIVITINKLRSLFIMLIFSISFFSRYRSSNNEVVNNPDYDFKDKQLEILSQISETSKNFQYFDYEYAAESLHNKLNIENDKVMITKCEDEIVQFILKKINRKQHESSFKYDFLNKSKVDSYIKNCFDKSMRNFFKGLLKKIAYENLKQRATNIKNIFRINQYKNHICVYSCEKLLFRDVPKRMLQRYSAKIFEDIYDDLTKYFYFNRLIEWFSAECMRIIQIIGRCELEILQFTIHRHQSIQKVDKNHEYPHNITNNTNQLSMCKSQTFETELPFASQHSKNSLDDLESLKVFLLNTMKNSDLISKDFSVKHFNNRRTNPNEKKFSDMKSDNIINLFLKQEYHEIILPDIHETLDRIFQSSHHGCPKRQISIPSSITDLACVISLAMKQILIEKYVQEYRQFLKKSFMDLRNKTIYRILNDFAQENQNILSKTDCSYPINYLNQQIEKIIDGGLQIYLKNPSKPADLSSIRFKTNHSFIVLRLDPFELFKQPNQIQGIETYTKHTKFQKGFFQIFEKFPKKLKPLCIFKNNKIASISLKTDIFPALVFLNRVFFEQTDSLDSCGLDSIDLNEFYIDCILGLINSHIDIMVIKIYSKSSLFNWINMIQSYFDYFSHLVKVLNRGIPSLDTQNTSSPDISSKYKTTSLLEVAFKFMISHKKQFYSDSKIKEHIKKEKEKSLHSRSINKYYYNEYKIHGICTRQLLNSEMDDFLFLFRYGKHSSSILSIFEDLKSHIYEFMLSNIKSEIEKASSISVIFYEAALKINRDNSNLKHSIKTELIIIMREFLDFHARMNDSRNILEINDLLGQTEKGKKFRGVLKVDILGDIRN